MGAHELIEVVDRWRNKATIPNARAELDWSKAREELWGSMQHLTICLSPPLVDGIPVLPSEPFNPEFKGWLPVETHLVKARNGSFMAAGFTGFSACEVVMELGKATDFAFHNLERAKNKKHYDNLVTEAMREYAEKKVAGLHLDYPKIIEAKVLLNVEQNRHIAERSFLYQ